MAKVVAVSKCVLATNAALRNLWANFSKHDAFGKGATATRTLSSAVPTTAIWL